MHIKTGRIFLFQIIKFTPIDIRKQIILLTRLGEIEFFK